MVHSVAMVARGREAATARGTENEAAPVVFVSTAVSGDIARMLGAPHYSYHFAEQRFGDMLRRRGVAPYRLTMPESYAKAAALPVRAGGGRGLLHLIFRSTEQIRLLKPAVNICCFPWEFPVLKTETLPGEHPFANQARMLGLCDEVWTPSAFGCRVLRAHGVGAVHHIPAPVAVPERRATRAEALAGIGGIEAVSLRTHFLWPRALGEQQEQALLAPLYRLLGDRTRTVYLSVLNPEDFRKNLDAMLRGFHLFRVRHPDAVLIVKALTARSRYGLAQLASDVIPNKLASGSAIADDGILLVNAYLSDAQMSLLYSLADFYLCTSIAEGQNLPLLEAMAHGTVAVSTRNTAMEDYIDDSTAFVIRSREVDNDSEHLAGTVAGRPFRISLCGARDVHDALRAAQSSTRAARERRASAGIAMVRQRFAEDAVWPHVQTRLSHHRV